MSRMIPVALVLVLTAQPALAQGSLVGTWKVSYPAATSVQNGVQTLIMGTGTLRVEARGDSLVGELVSDSVAGFPPRPPTRMTGPAGRGVVSLLAHLTGTIEVNGESRTVSVTSTWALEARADSVVGTLSHSVEGTDGIAQDPGPVHGTRLKP